MATRKQYTGSTENFEKKLGRVMVCLGVEKYQSSWSQRKGGASCFVEMIYDGKAYRFENSTEKSSACGWNICYVSDPFAEVVYSLAVLIRETAAILDMRIEEVLAVLATVMTAPVFPDKDEKGEAQ